MRHGGLKLIVGTGLVLGLAAGWAVAQPAPPVPPSKVAPPAKTPAKAETPKTPAEDLFAGEYEGTVTQPAGMPAAAEAKIVPAGADGYQLILSWNEGGRTARIRWPGRADGAKLVFDGKTDEIQLTGSAADKKLVLDVKGKYNAKFSLSQATSRKSPDEGAPPPEGAAVLLGYAEGKAPALDAWTNVAWKALPDGSLAPGPGKDGNLTKKSFGDIRMHLEFFIPQEPGKPAKDRGSAGLYLMGRYEIRLLDSFGQEPTVETCGAIYGVRAPRVDQCMTPGRWQTLDIVFRAPKVEDGKIFKAGIVTVVMNGKKIHDIVKVDKTSDGGVAGPPAESAPLMLQNHGSQIRFRNLWVVELKEGELGGL
jgi:hypothetical protein